MARRTSGMWLAVLATLVLAAAHAPAQELTGTYDCVGDNGNGTSYKGTVKIGKNGDTYTLQWSIAGATHVGVGILHDNTLSSSWATVVGGRIIKGVVIYKVEKDKLVGQWAQYPGNGKILKETLTKQ